MLSVTVNIVLGIVTGLLTATILLILKSLFFSSFLPWYRQVMYKGLKIEGSWYSVSRAQKVLIELNQSCETLTGKATVLLSKDGIPKEMIDGIEIDDIRTFDVKGEVSERFVSLQLKHTDRSRLGVVSYLLQIDGDGTKLSGKSSWYAPLISDIHAGSETFYRDESRAIRAKDRERTRASVSFAELEQVEIEEIGDQVEEETNKKRQSDA
ncbi:hypothetical protein [Shewanella algae]|uniref:hypothetical protein n=1 Tax=Shewanella algae TaxID=38313 RepID=UPI0031F4D9C3